MADLTRRAVLAAAVSAGVAGRAAAQGAPPMVRLRGRIAGFDGEVLTVTARDGSAQAVLVADAPIASLRRVTVAELAPGTNLGVVAEPDAEGLRAIAVTVLPASATRQFQSPWDLSEGSSMNNGAVGGVMQRADGHQLILSINGRDVPVRIDARSALVQPVAAAKADLRAGAAVFVNATRGADGRLTATRVTVEKDGVAPPT
jgi:hypothetical protein